MTTIAIENALKITDRRLAILDRLGERVRNTVAWREAVAERAELGRRIAFVASWKAI